MRIFKLREFSINICELRLTMYIFINEKMINYYHVQIACIVPFTTPVASLSPPLRSKIAPTVSM